MRGRRENKTKQILLGAIIVFIMVASVIGFMSGRDSGQELRYNDYSFIRKGNLWETKINNHVVDFYYFPTEVADIDLNETVVRKITNTPMVYLTYDQNQSNVEFIAQSQFELGNLLSEQFNIYPATALARENDYGLPVVSCKNATNAVPVINFVKTNETRISLEGDCIVMEAKSGYDFFKAKDRLVYGLLGIIK